MVGSINDPGGPNIMNYDGETTDGYFVPMDPMDLLQCESCQ